ncbi:hypothetical protein MMC18_008852 [Xylographa bjoerkii]|nr:hypothetical protein [Xylographa bjoerkii]MCJ1395966.1 hypothetical protein [Xylographa bjoerkii]
MTLQRRSLLNYLRIENPVIHERFTGQGNGNTRSKKDQWLVPDSIEPWCDFEYQSLRHTYGGDLQSLLQHESDLPDPVIDSFPLCAISDEDSLLCVNVAWNQQVVNKALSEAQAGLENYETRENIYMAKGGQARCPGSHNPNSTAAKCAESYNPDWAAIRQSLDQIRCYEPKPKHSRRLSPNTLLPGDTKLSKKWSSEKIQDGPLDIEYLTSRNWVLPLSQVYTYCIRAEVRYGYIISDKELVVLRVRPSPEFLNDTQLSQDSGVVHKSETVPIKPAVDRAVEAGILEWKAIPWRCETGSGAEAITVNLALWWLHLMAAQNNEIRDEYPALQEDTWSERIIKHDWASYPTPEPANAVEERSIADDDSNKTPKAQVSYQTPKPVRLPQGDLAITTKDSSSAPYLNQTSLNIAKKRSRTDDNSDDAPHGKRQAK